MADRNMQFPHGQGFSMMQSQPQYVQPGAPVMPQQRMMMAQGHMMNPGQGHMMFPNQGQGHMVAPGMYAPQNQAMGMRMPAARAPPPSYSQSHAETYQQRMKHIGGTRPQGPRPPGKTEEQLQKERKFHEQQARLKQFGRGSAAGGGGLDPNKLIDSMFRGQEPPKPRTIKKQAPQVKEEPDDSFGDFLSSPQIPMEGPLGAASNGTQGTTPPPPTQPAPGQPGQGTTPPPTQQSPGPAGTPPQPQKKDLTEMMYQSCDLTAPQKAKLFQKPSLKEINMGQKANSLVTHHDSDNARKWSKVDELSDLFIQEAVKDEQTLPKVAPAVVKKHVSPTSKHPPKPPPWLTDETLLPALYKQVLEAVTVDEQISTERLFPILMMSGLPKDTMGHLWSLCNKITPGQLRTVELYELLGLIGLTQNNYQVEALDILSRCPYPPVPYLGQPVPQPAPAQSPPQPPIPGAPVPAQSPPHPVPGAPLPAQSPPVPFPGVAMPAQSPPLSSPGVQPPITPPVQSIMQQHPFIPTNPVQTTIGPDQSKVLYQETHFPSSAPVQPAVGMGVSSPATLPVTQLPPAVLSQGMVANVVQAAQEDEDFADFQAAPTPQAAPVEIPKPSPVTSPANIPVQNQPRYISSVPIPDDKAVEASLPANELQKSTVENFFGSDDSSEATSPDDDYFDGYKSADSKPSDSTSQFSTDQSEGEDFRNFENYLDEFQRKKEQLDKESPLHRPVSRFLKESSAKSPTKVFPKTAQVTQIQKIPLPTKVVKPTPKGQVLSDEFSDFADFQSAPVADKSVSEPDPLKATASASDLIGEEDKYAALRVLDFSSPPTEEPNPLDSQEPETEVKPPADQEESWADFQTADDDIDQTSSEAVSGVNVDSTTNTQKDSILQLYGKEDDDEWAAFDSAQKSVSSDTSWSASLPPPSTDETEQSVSVKTSTNVDNSWTVGDTGNDTDDWADFQSTDQEGFPDVQATAGTASSSSATLSADPTTEEVSRDSSSNSLVNVKKEQLGTTEILGLFKVKDEPKLDVKSRDDDMGGYMASSSSVSENINKLHGISNQSSRESSPYKDTQQKRPKLPSEDDDFMKPPPLDMTADDDDNDHFGSYTRGYDLDDIMQPKLEEKKKVYGVYGVNQNFVVSGHKKDTKTGEETRNVTIEITKDSDIDNDSDSVSSKENDTFRGKFGLGKELGEDSQSVSSLDFVVNKRLQTVKDTEGADNQSVSSAEFGTIERSYSTASMQESKSVDSLELRGDDTTMDSAGSQDSSDKESKEVSPERDTTDDSFVVFDVPAPGLPVVGDRYSSIMHDVPGSDKHACEWELCLESACRMIQDANNTFNSISSSAVCNEVIKSSQGAQYIDGVIEIYKVICRITVSATKAGVHSDKLSQLLKSIDLAWNNLTAFLVGGSVMPDSQSLDFSHGVLLSDDMTAQYRSCGVCLLDVEMRQRGPHVDNDDNAVLVYGGRQYHAPCANFWVNCVSSTLPALKLLELL